MNKPRISTIPLPSLRLTAVLLALSGAAGATGPGTDAALVQQQEADPGRTERQDADATEKKAAGEGRQQAVEEIEQAAREPWRERWRRFRSATRDISEWNVRDGMFRMRFGLRLQVDLTGGDDTDTLADSVGPIDESADLRRARLFADGDFLRRFHFRFEYDFAVDQGLKDAYIDNLLQPSLKVVALRAGNMKEPFSLERHTSGYYGGFLETSLPVATFVPGRNLGATLHGMHLQGRLSWAAGAFTNSSSSEDNSSNSDLTFTARATGLAFYRDDGRRLLHLGASYSLRSPKGNDLRYRTRPEARFAPFFLDTGDLAADTAQLFGVELAGVHGPFWAQAEVIGVHAAFNDFGHTWLSGGYGQVGWFLTGESRPYVHSDGTFGRLEPKHPFRTDGARSRHGGMGALELAGRISWIDLNDGDVQAGRMLDTTFGVNWYLTRATRVMFNWVRSQVTDVGHANVFLIRYQFNPGYHWPPLDPTRSWKVGRHDRAPG